MPKNRRSFPAAGFNRFIAVLMQLPLDKTHWLIVSYACKVNSLYSTAGTSRPATEADMESDDLTGSILLLDIYGGLLTTRQRELIKLHLEEDLSLGEIAAMEGISRQGVRDSIVKGMRIMNNAEQQLGLLDKELRLRALLNLMKKDAAAAAYAAEMEKILFQSEPDGL